MNFLSQHTECNGESQPSLALRTTFKIFLSVPNAQIWAPCFQTRKDTSKPKVPTPKTTGELMLILSHILFKFSSVGLQFHWNEGLTSTGKNLGAIIT